MSDQVKKDQEEESALTRIAEAIGAPVSIASKRILRAIYRPLLHLAPEKAIDRYIEAKTRLDDQQLRTQVKYAALEMKKQEVATMLRLLEKQEQLGSPEFVAGFEWYQSKINETSIYSNALLSMDEHQSDHSRDDSDISSHWFDNFRQFARMRNEPWRQRLLCNALRREGDVPGSVSNRSVWNVGMLDPCDFYDIQDFIKYSCKLYEDGQFRGFFMVGLYLQLTKSDYKRSDDQIDTIDELFKRLEALGFIATGNGVIDLWSGKKYLFEMGELKFSVQLDKGQKNKIEEEFLKQHKAEEFADVEAGNKRFSFYAMPMSPLGNNIAQLCSRIPSAEAEGRFAQALKNQAEELGIDLTLEV